MSGSSNILRLEFHLCYLNDALEKILVVVLFNSFTSSMDCPPVTMSSMLYFCKPFKWCCMTPPSRGSAHGAYPLGILVLEPMKSQRIPVIVTNAYLKKRLFDITRQSNGMESSSH